MAGPSRLCGPGSRGGSSLVSVSAAASTSSRVMRSGQLVQLRRAALKQELSQPIEDTLVCRLNISHSQASNAIGALATNVALGPGQVAANTEVLRLMYGSKEQAAEKLLNTPELLAVDLPQWFEFWVEGYRLPLKQFAKVCESNPELLAYGRADVYHTGQSILFFKQMGWQDCDIVRRLLAQYPNLLLDKRVERDMAPVVDYLHQVGCEGDDLRLLVWEFPRVFSKDFRRQIRKFACLGIYGLQLSRLR